ncbi:unnamed protein product [Schistosoma mattheei]|uniref:Uncharacterized protein n=1 Tax=Schistosoma mattheei TaxID=31246 RepID=A0A3P8GD76_9TREM|nr:unnamed protein product [Schistosoma mattheei]
MDQQLNYVIVIILVSLLFGFLLTDDVVLFHVLNVYANFLHVVASSQ